LVTQDFTGLGHFSNRDDSIPIDYEEIVDLDETHFKEIITPGVDLEDGIMKTTQNTI
jgi:hypothetical protein